MMDRHSDELLELNFVALVLHDGQLEDVLNQEPKCINFPMILNSNHLLIWIGFVLVTTGQILEFGDFELAESV